MTPKEIVLNAIQFKETPRLPTAVLDGYLWMIQKNNLSFKDLYEMGDQKAVSLILKTYEELGSDLVYGNASALGALREVMGGQVDFSVIGKSAVITKPAMKELAEIKNYSVNEVFSKLIAHPYYVTMIRQLERLAENAGDENLIMSFCLGPLTMAATMCGVQELMMALYEDADIVIEVLLFISEISIRMIAYQLQHGANAIYISDPVSSVNMISENFFAEYSLPNLKKITAELQRESVPIVLHICGNATSRLEPLKDAGIDVFSVDAVDMKSALMVARGHYALLGNLSPVDVLKNKTAAEVYGLASSLAKTAGHNGGFILAPGCDLAPETPLENIRAMANAAHDATG